MRVEEAVANSRVGTARALDARGRTIGAASGPSFTLSARKRRKRGLTFQVSITPLPASRVLTPMFIKLHRASQTQREFIDGLNWQPDEPITVVDRIASLLRRGRVKT